MARHTLCNLPFLPALLAPIHDVCNLRRVTLHLGNRRALEEYRSSRASRGAFPACSACLGHAPGLVEVGDHAPPGAASRNIPGMHALDLIAGAHAAGAKHAAIVIDPEARMRDIDGA